jgi:hypothetical protein
MRTLSGGSDSLVRFRASSLLVYDSSLCYLYILEGATVGTISPTEQRHCATQRHRTAIFSSAEEEVIVIMESPPNTQRKNKMFSRVPQQPENCRIPWGFTCRYVILWAAWVLGIFVVATCHFIEYEATWTWNQTDLPACAAVNNIEGLWIASTFATIRLGKPWSQNELHWLIRWSD